MRHFTRTRAGTNQKVLAMLSDLEGREFALVASYVVGDTLKHESLVTRGFPVGDLAKVSHFVTTDFEDRAARSSRKRNP